MAKHIPAIEFSDLHTRLDGLRLRLEPLAKTDTGVGRQAVAHLEFLDELRQAMVAQASHLEVARTNCGGEAFKVLLAQAQADWLDGLRRAIEAGLNSEAGRQLGLTVADLPLPTEAPLQVGGKAFRELVHQRAVRAREAEELAGARLRREVLVGLDEVQAWLTRPEVFRAEADLRLEEERVARAAREAEDQAREARLKFRAPPRPFVPTKIGEAAMAERSDRRAAREAEEARRAAEAEAKAKADLVARLVAEAMKAATLAILG